MRQVESDRAPWSLSRITSGYGYLMVRVKGDKATLEYISGPTGEVLDKVDDLSRSVETVKKGLSSDRFLQYLMLKSQAIDELNLRMKSAYSDVITDREKVLERLKGELIAMYPKSVLSRGYSIVYRQRDNIVVTDRKMVAEGDYVSVELAKGSFSAQVTD